MLKRRIGWLLLCLAGLSMACGKAAEKQTEQQVATSDSTHTALADSIKAHGLVVLRDDPAPAQQSSSHASLVVYRTSDGSKGGVVYVTRLNNAPTERVGWHWYFADEAPDSATMIEINRDGLWDARVYFADRSVDMIQGESFWLLGREHRGSEAMNGASSAPASLWRAFDGDTTTAWQSPADSAYIELPVPLGVSDGELEVQLGERNRPSKLDIYAGESKLQTIQLSDGTSLQTFGLDPAVRDASLLRVEVESAGSDSVAISELEIR